MEYDHSENYEINIGKAFLTGIAVNLVFIIAEAFFGFMSNSMALLADAGHNLSDVLALALSWIAAKLSMRKPTLKFTYGFRRSTILAALFNTIMLLAAIGFIAYETVHRFNQTTGINSKTMMVVASIGIIVNAFTAWLFMKGKKYDLNIRSAFMHFIADALVSFGVVLAGVLISLTGLRLIDSLVSFTIIAVILYGSYKLLIDAVNLALDAVPENIDIDKVREYLASLPEVEDVHDLHIWALSTSDSALTVHLLTREQTNINFITTIQEQLKKRYRIAHSTIQVEYGSMEDCGIEN